MIVLVKFRLRLVYYDQFLAIGSSKNLRHNKK
jgi:hypothetical protein